MTTAPDRYGVMGYPVSHSRSPVIHRLFALQTGENIQYELLQVAPDKLETAVRQFQRTDGKGLNVTVPFKQEAWEIADELSERARLAGAVNTLMMDEQGSLFGDNTDGVGLIRDLTQNIGFVIEGRHVLLLGAGGAASGVLAPLLEQQPASLHIANRTASRASELATAFVHLGELSASGLEDLPTRQYGLVINASAAGLQGESPVLPVDTIDADTWCYDMVYGSEPTAFMRYAASCGCRHSFDGLGMLVEQAAESFYLWRGVMPETAPVIDILREDNSRLTAQAKQKRS